MKPLNKSGSKIEVEFHKLENSQKALFETLIVDNNIKFERDKTNGLYTAMIKMDKDIVSANIPKSTQKAEKRSKSPQVNAKTDYTSHKECRKDEVIKREFSPFKDQKHPIKPIKTKSQILIETARLSSKTNHSSREILMREGKTLNITRSNILESYDDCFPNIDFSRILFSPVHMSLVFMLQKIEFFYNKVFDNIQRKKSSESVNLARAITDYFEKEYHGSVAYYHQSLANLVYTGHKRIEIPEIELFMSFLQEPPGNLKLLFYLYVRQIVKIVTANFFLSHKATDLDPSKIFLTRTQISEILTQAFYFDDTYRQNLENALYEFMDGKKGLEYYVLLVCVFNFPAKREVI